MWYPAADRDADQQLGTAVGDTLAGFPLIVFAHGITNEGAQGAFVAAHLATHGYVVIGPDFPLSKGTAPGGPVPTDIAGQAGDVIFLTQAFQDPRLQAAFPPASQVNFDRIGVLGYLLGGATVALAGAHPSIDAVGTLGPAACLLYESGVSTTLGGARQGPAAFDPQGPLSRFRQRGSQRHAGTNTLSTLWHNCALRVDKYKRCAYANSVVGGSRQIAGRPWRLDLQLRRNGATPVYRQIADALIADIRRGRLPPGHPLPGARVMAVELGVTRKVVSAALSELQSQGWTFSQRGKGTFVSRTLPIDGFIGAPGSSDEPASGGEPERPRGLRLDDGLPDTRLAPLQDLVGAYRDALQRLRSGGLGYGNPQGDPALRDVLSSFVNQARGLTSTPDGVLITRGSQMALFLIARSVTSNGGRACIAVEDPGYRPAWNAFELAGAHIEYVAVDEHGICSSALRALVEKRRIHALYITPHHQYPTTVSLSPRRREHLVELARTHDFTIIEDDYDSEFQFAPRPMLPLSASSGMDRSVYIGSFSKLLAPGMRLGYLLASEGLINAAVNVRRALDRVGDPAQERAIAYLIEDGTLQRSARKARRVYEARRTRFVDRLREDPVLSRCLRFNVPEAGLALWLRAHTSQQVHAWSRRARGAGLHFTPGSAYASANSQEAAFRVGFASLDESEIDRAVHLLTQTVPPGTQPLATPGDQKTVSGEK